MLVRVDESEVAARASEEVEVRALPRMLRGHRLVAGAVADAAREWPDDMLRRRARVQQTLPQARSTAKNSTLDCVQRRVLCTICDIAAGDLSRRPSPKVGISGRSIMPIIRPSEMLCLRIAVIGLPEYRHNRRVLRTLVHRSTGRTPDEHDSADSLARKVGPSRDGQTHI